jgi:hypothetical protein
MIRSRRRTVVLALAGLLLAASASQAVVIYFKDGSKEIVADRYHVDGNHVIATLQSGQETAIPLAAVDLEKTEAMNKVAKGSAIVIDRSIPGESTQAERAKTVRDLMRERSTLPTPVPLVKTVSRTLRTTPAGNVDYLNMPHRELAGDRASSVASLLRQHGLRDASAFQGTTASRVLVDLVTPSKNAVFEALQKCATVLLELRSTEPGVEALELSMATSAKSRAGQFVLTPDDAERLKSGATTPADYFVASVLF